MRGRALTQPEWPSERDSDPYRAGESLKSPEPEPPPSVTVRLRYGSLYSFLSGVTVGAVWFEFLGHLPFDRRHGDASSLTLSIALILAVGVFFAVYVFLGTLFLRGGLWALPGSWLAITQMSNQHIEAFMNIYHSHRMLVLATAMLLPAAFGLFLGQRIGRRMKLHNPQSEHRPTVSVVEQPKA